MAKLSVVTITFNDSAGLANTMKSLPLTQIDWIVVDGSNESKTLRINREILKNVACRHIQEPDRGRFHAMNKGLSFVNSELVSFLNSGDMYARKRVVHEIEESFEKHHWDWAVGQTIGVNSMGIRMWKWPMPQPNSLKFKLSIRSFSHQATVYRTEFIRELGGYVEDSLYSDWLLSLKMSKKVKPYIHDKNWCHFLAGGISSMQTIDYWRKECIRLRQLEGLEIGKSRVLDKLLQNTCALLLMIDRGKLLLRPDLSKKYGADLGKN